jgi:hypothetical protein
VERGGRTQLRRQARAAHLVDVSYHNGGTFTCEAVGGSGANSLRRSDDDRDAIIKPSSHLGHQSLQELM